MTVSFLGLLIGCTACLSGNYTESNVNTKMEISFEKSIKTYSNPELECKGKSYNPASINKVGAFLLRNKGSQKTIVLPYIVNKLGNKQFVEFIEKKQVFYTTCEEYTTEENMLYFNKVQNQEVEGYFYITQTARLSDNFEKVDDVKVKNFEVFQTTEYEIFMKDLFKKILDEVFNKKQPESTSSKQLDDVPNQVAEQVSHTELELHKLVVVSLSKGLDRIGTTIQDAFIQFLDNEKADKSNFDIFTIKTGRRVEKLSIPINLNKIKDTFVFSADDLRAMDDLILLDNIVRKRDSNASQRIGKILYITDNSFLEDNAKDVPSDQLGVIRVWHELYNIRVSVLTTGKCSSWKQGAKASCSQINRRSNIQELLEDFILK